MQGIAVIFKKVIPILLSLSSATVFAAPGELTESHRTETRLCPKKADGVPRAGLGK
jgi:hypothetical protein